MLGSLRWLRDKDPPLEEVRSDLVGEFECGLGGHDHPVERRVRVCTVAWLEGTPRGARLEARVDNGAHIVSHGCAPVHALTVWVADGERRAVADLAIVGPPMDRDELRGWIRTLAPDVVLEDRAVDQLMAMVADVQLRAFGP